MSQGGALSIVVGAGGPVNTLTPDSGGPVSPVANNINVNGLNGITTLNGGAGVLQIKVTGGADKWQTISASQTLAVNNGYICTSGGPLLLALPAVSAVGDEIEITLDGSTKYTVTQAAGQQIRIGSNQSTLGATGTIFSQAQGDTVRMVCSVANTKWNVLSSMGTLGFT